MMRAAALIALALAAVPSSEARANGYDGAKEMIVEAEAHLAAGREAEGLALLTRALRAQSTADRWRKPYGYARYILFRLARLSHARGERARAKRELVAALAVHDGQEYVDEPFRVSMRDPFILESFPELAQPKLERHPAHAIVPRAVYLHNGSGPYLYAVGFTALYRLHRGQGTLETLHQQPNDSLYRFDAHPDDKRLILTYERDRYIYALALDPWVERRVLKPGPVDHLHLDRAGTSAVVYSRSGTYGVTVRRVSLDAPAAAPASQPRTPSRAAPLLSFDGHVLAPHGEHVVYATFSERQARERFHPAYSPLYEHVRAQSFAGGDAPRTLHTFSPVTFGNRASAVEGRSGARVAVYVADLGQRRRLLMLHDFTTGATRSHPLAVELAPTRGRAKMELSWSEDWLVLLEQAGTALRVLRFDPQTGATRELGRVDRRAASAEVHGFGTLRDNQTVWLHRSDELVLLEEGRPPRAANLKRWARRPRPEWAGASYYFPDPEQFYLGIEQRAWRYFMKVGLGDLRRAAR